MYIDIRIYISLNSRHSFQNSIADRIVKVNGVTVPRQKVAGVLD